MSDQSAAAYLRVCNWEEFQHYRDRLPPWIKLHNSLLQDYDFTRLQDASKAHLMLIWLLASRLNNCLPNDPKWISNQIGATSRISLKTLIATGFLELVEQDASKCVQVARPETETETETETEGEGEGEGEEKRVFDAWLTTLNGSSRKLTAGRRKKIGARLRSFPVAELEEAVQGWQFDDWPERPKHNDLTVLLRNDEQVEKFRDLYRENHAKAERAEELRGANPWRVSG